MFHNSVCLITQHFFNCTSCEELDVTWRHAQIRIRLQGFSLGLCWAQVVLPLLVCHQQYCQGHLCAVYLSILEPVVPCPSLVSEGIFDF